uniref:Uncharacterized protein n=1 Tax=Glossina brevipalpis TaxID=37001 RepID=A0A1A9X0L5_9MUSC
MSKIIVALLLSVVWFMAYVTYGGVVETHHLLDKPVVARVGAVVHSDPSYVSHQSTSQVHSKAVIHPALAPLVKTTIHTSTMPVTKKSYDPLVQSYSVPLFHSVVH